MAASDPADALFTLQYEPLSDYLSEMAEIVQLNDKAMLPLIVSSYVRNRVDITLDQLTGVCLPAIDAHMLIQAASTRAKT
jgi:hypothetical protein